MQTIKFSHKYKKMPDDVSDTRLLEVFTIHYNELSTVFKSYDTLYNTRCDNGYVGYFYKLPNTNLLVLLLISNGVLWTTIRRFTEKKETYYRALRGQRVKIEIKESVG